METTDILGILIIFATVMIIIRIIDHKLGNDDDSDKYYY